MTTNLIDIQHADVIMATSNMAENHPVGFQWVMKAKERGAKLIHVDPRYTRTSAAADLHVPLRSGTNIAFFGGLMHHAIQKTLYFKDYIVHYTNASFLLDPAFKNATDLNGLFTGYDAAKKSYDRASWKYQIDAEGNPKRDLTLKDPNTVFQHLKRHYSRYTPAMVERVCGIPKAKFEEAAQLFCSTSGPDKTGTITYALNLTQHTNGVENIRALCMLQVLLGSIGRPGGGVTALRGHANVQGATDLELLYHELPGYMAQPLRDAHPDLTAYMEKETPKGGFWVNKPKFFVSLLKAFYGDAATKDNEYGYQWLLKRAKADAYSHQHIFVDMYNGMVKGFLALGQNPAVGGPNAKLARSAMQRLDWLVVKDIFLTETAEIWKAPGVDPKTVKTEVFFMPAAPAAEKDGSLTNTMRLIQWHEKAVTPPGDVTSDAEFVCTLARRLQALYAGSKKERDRGFLAASFKYGDNPKEPEMVEVLKEINGYATEDITDKDGKVWSEKKKLIWWDAEAPGNEPSKKGKWVGLDVPDFNPFLAPDAKNGDKPFIMRTDLVGGFFGPLNDGPFPEHYEPIESPVRNLLSKQQNNPVAKIWQVPDQQNELAPTGSAEYPYVITTYRLTEHHLSGVMSRYLPMLAELHHSHFTEISHELADELALKNGDMVTVATPRGKIHVRAMVTNRLKPFVIDGKKVHQIGVPWHWGYNGIAELPGSRGDITNDLSATVGDPNVYIQETKAFMCNVKKGVV